MSPQDRERAVLLFNQALELESGERQGFVGAHSGNEEVRREVESLLAAHARADSFLRPPSAPRNGAALAAAQTGALIGSVVNSRYEIVSELGSGGQGVAYLARDLSVGNRQVVVKMLWGLVGEPNPVQSSFRREVD